jgi:hypothetical protein
VSVLTTAALGYHKVTVINRADGGRGSLRAVLQRDWLNRIDEGAVRVPSVTRTAPSRGNMSGPVSARCLVTAR